MDHGIWAAAMSSAAQKLINMGVVTWFAIDGCLGEFWWHGDDQR